MPKLLLKSTIAALAVLASQTAVLTNDALAQIPPGGNPHRLAEASVAKPDEVSITCRSGSFCS